MADYSVMLAEEIVSALEESYGLEITKTKVLEEDPITIVIHEDMTSTHIKEVNMIRVYDDSVESTVMYNGKVSNEYLKLTEEFADFYNDRYEGTLLIQENDGFFNVFYRRVEEYDGDELFDEELEDEREELAKLMAYGTSLLFEFVVNIMDDSVWKGKTLKETKDKWLDFLDSINN